MKTPLQVLIMTIILERIGNLPPDRYQLFWRYYDTIYDRETAKNTTLASLLTQHRGSITQLHEAVGLTLQVRAETSGDSRALLPLPDLHRLADGAPAGTGPRGGTGRHRHWPTRSSSRRHSALCSLSPARERFRDIRGPQPAGTHGCKGAHRRALTRRSPAAAHDRAEPSLAQHMGIRRRAPVR